MWVQSVELMDRSIKMKLVAKHYTQALLCKKKKYLIIQ